MDEYIERKALLNALKEERKNGNFVFTSKWIKEIMDNLPTADVVPKSDIYDLKAMLDAAVAGQETLQKALAEAKSEVEEISGEYEDLKLKYADLVKDRNELLAWGGHIRSTEKVAIKAEAEREIFEAIDAALEKSDCLDKRGHRRSDHQRRPYCHCIKKRSVPYDSYNKDLLKNDGKGICGR
jgi:chromosome segregation ATPase